MKKNLIYPVAFFIVSWMPSCGPTLKVSTDFDNAINFQQYKTFSLYKSDSSLTALSPLNKDRLENAIKSAMTKKGFQENNSNPDVWVNTVAIFKDRVSLSSTTNYYGYGGIYRPYIWGTGAGVSGVTTYDAQHYKDGSVVIDIIDAKTKKLVWQGTGNSEIDQPLKKPDEQIPEAVTKIMAGFPPGDTKK